MTFKGVLAIFFIVSLQQLVTGDAVNLWQKSPSSSILLENQLQAIVREQQYLVNQLIRNGVHQVESSAKQLQASQSIQTAVSNALAAKGLNDLNGMARSILSNDIRQCYELNKFTFSDAINTARTTAMQCITDKLNQGKMIADNAIKDIRTVIQDIRSAGQMIAECRQFLISFPSVAGAVAKVACLSQAMINMKSGAILLPINLGRRVIEANEAISTIQSDVVKCNLDILTAIITQASEAGRVIINCISQPANGTLI